MEVGNCSDLPFPEGEKLSSERLGDLPKVTQGFAATSMLTN
jgi:hypothetical protein